MRNVYLKREVVYESEISEIDFKLKEEFGFDYEKHEDFLIEGDSNGYADAYPIKIEHIIQELVNMKDAGATHVEIGYHCDHIGYIFEGYRIKPMDKSEVEEIKNMKAKNDKKIQEIADLKQRIKELESADDRFNQIVDDLPF